MYKLFQSTTGDKPKRNTYYKMVGLILTFFTNAVFASYLSFSSYEWPHIKEWECGKPCKKPCNILQHKVKDKKGKVIRDYWEFNCFGLTVKDNADLYATLINRAFNQPINYRGFIDAPPPEPLIKKRAYKKYFKPYEKLPKCIRLAVVDMAYLSGHWKATTVLQRALGIKADGIMGRNTLKYAKNKASRELLDKITKTYASDIRSFKNVGIFGKGWIRRLNSVRKKAVKNCVK